MKQLFNTVEVTTICEKLGISNNKSRENSPKLMVRSGTNDQQINHYMTKILAIHKDLHHHKSRK